MQVSVSRGSQRISARALLWKIGRRSQKAQADCQGAASVRPRSRGAGNREGWDELACKPGSVPAGAGDGHPSGAAVASDLVRSTPELGRAALERSGRNPKTSLRPCSGWGLPSRPGRPGRWWALTPPFHPYRCKHRRSVFCGTFPRVTPGRCYRSPCPVEPGLSSTATPKSNRRDRPANSSRTQASATGDPCR